MDNLSNFILEQGTAALANCKQYFQTVDNISFCNTKKILDAYRKHQVSDYLFRSTTGYGYSDAGRDKLEEIFAEVFGAEKALVRTQFVSGTHALATALFGNLKYNDELVSLTGAPYDTMQTVIGSNHNVPGSLTDNGIIYKELPLLPNGVDMSRLSEVISNKTKMVLIQRSRGYSLRKPLTIKEIEDICVAVKKINKNCICFVDNCYGEFVDEQEPTHVGADLIAGSL